MQTVQSPVRIMTLNFLFLFLIFHLPSARVTRIKKDIRELLLIVHSENGCIIRINKDIREPQPLLLVPSEENVNFENAFLLPSENDIIKLKEKEIVRVACPGGSLKINTNNIFKDVADAVCLSDGRFEINGQRVFFSDITCTIAVKRIARYTENRCLESYNEALIGFMVKDRVLKHIDICFDGDQYNVVYSKFYLTRTIDGQQKGTPPSTFKGEEFFDDLEVNNLYTIDSQRKVINNLLGLKEDSCEYIGKNSTLYLARAHLTAKIDFLYGAQHRLTYNYVNVAPLWQPVNVGNWYAVERSVRYIASSQNKDLIIYTGTYGIMTLPHANSLDEIELFLYVSETKKGIPVPRLVYKVLYEPLSKTGVVFLCVNDPFRLDKRQDVICSDICYKYDKNWLKWDQSDPSKGYVYCCSIEDFRETVKTLPYFEVNGLLE